MRIPTRRRFAQTLTLATTLALVFTACGSDDGGDVRDIGGEASSASGSASASATADAECHPVNPDLAGDAETEVEIQLADFAFAPSAIELPAGVVTFQVENVGEEPHELAFLPGGGEVPLIEDDAPDEEALEEAGAFELEAFGPGQTCTATYDLAPGDYTIFCIVETEEGDTHLHLGMQGTLTVTG